MTMIRGVRLVVLLVGLAALAAPAAAQTNDEATPFPSLQWNFSTPGARANGMGRSFIGLADDASAAVTNPAGLTNLTRMQVYGEYKNTQLRIDRLAAVDALRTLQPTTNKATVNSLSFLSVSYPINTKLAVGFSIYRFLDYHETFNFDARSIPNHPTNNALFPITGSADFTGDSYGGSVAYAVTPQSRVGGTISANRVDLQSLATRNGITFGASYPGPNQTGGNLNDLRGNNIIANQTSISDTLTKVSGSLGVLFKVNDMVSAGFSYSKGPKYTSSENLQINPGYNSNPALATNQPLTQATNFPKPFSLNVPDHFGAGVSVRPIPQLLIAADAVRINYSVLSQNTTLVFFPTLTGNEFVTPDVTEIHVGAEYNVYNMMGNPIFVRGGVFTNPAHFVTFTGSSDPAINASETANYNLLPRSDETRGTVGVGIAIGPRGQVDAAYVFGREFVLSAAVRF